MDAGTLSTVTDTATIGVIKDVIMHYTDARIVVLVPLILQGIKMIAEVKKVPQLIKNFLISLRDYFILLGPAIGTALAFPFKVSWVIGLCSGIAVVCGWHVSMQFVKNVGMANGSNGGPKPIQP